MLTTPPRVVRLGGRDVTFPSDELRQLVDSSGLLDDADALVDRLATDGYLYLPGLLPRVDVVAARDAVIAYMAEQGGLDPGAPGDDAVIVPSARPVRLLGQRAITHRPEVLDVLAAAALFDLFERVHGEPVVTFDFKWLRAVGTGEFTGVHVDRVYMGRGSQRLMTAWVPIGDVPVELGTLCVCPGSHVSPRLDAVRRTYGRMDVDRDRIEGWFTTDPWEITEHFGGTWFTGDMRAGDVIVFGMDLMHASTTNVSDRWRLSCDVRFQPAADRADERWVGPSPIGHGPWMTEPGALTPMSVARARWGIAAGW